MGEWGDERCGVYISEADAGSDSVELEAKSAEEDGKEGVKFETVPSAAVGDDFGEEVIDGERESACRRIMDGCVLKRAVGAVVRNEALQVGQRRRFLWK